MRKHERDLRQIAKGFGATVTMRNSGHFAIALPNGATYTTSATPSDYRARRNVLRDLRRLAEQ